ncbi:MAG: hypothetical protein GY797_15730, partial [Deltaproteobacteria bacterium]|nr:hypothetical protein [Deltaproteobacteria bacterium]
RQKAAANAQDEERMLIKLLVIQHLANKRIEQSQKERSSSWALEIENMNETSFFDTPERTCHSDEGFGALGRALRFAQAYESNCRALVSLLDLKKSVGSGDISPSPEDDEYQNFIQKLWKRNLGGNLIQLRDSYCLPADIYSILDKARKARNFIAHEICLGIIDTIESEGGRTELIITIKSKTEEIADGDRYICLLMQIITKEPIPSSKYFEEYPDIVSKWVCKVYDE